MLMGKIQYAAEKKTKKKKSLNQLDWSLNQLDWMLILCLSWYWCDQNPSKTSKIDQPDKTGRHT